MENWTPISPATVRDNTDHYTTVESFFILITIEYEVPKTEIRNLMYLELTYACILAIG